MKPLPMHAALGWWKEWGEAIPGVGGLPTCGPGSSVEPGTLLGTAEEFDTRENCP